MAGGRLTGRVLALDTAGPVIGVALALDGDVRVRTERVRRGAESRLVPWVQELCAEGGVALTGLDGLAVSVGPGAFTGLRVGLATALGLALGAGLPVWGCGSLRARAAAAAEPDTDVLAMLDARKQRVYAALFRDGRALRGPEDCAPGHALRDLQPGFVATGEGSALYAEQVLEAGGRLAAAPEDPGVAALARLGLAGLARGEGTDPTEVRPVYVRAPDARPRAVPSRQQGG